MITQWFRIPNANYGTVAVPIYRLSKIILWNGTSNGFVCKAKWDHLNRLALEIRQKTFDSVMIVRFQAELKLTTQSIR